MGEQLAHFGLSLFLVLITLLSAIAQDGQQDNSSIENADSDSTLVYSYLEAADKAGGEGHILKQRQILGDAHSIADSLANPSLLKTVGRDLGEYYLNTNQFDSAQVVLEQASELPSDRELQTQVLNFLGTAYNYQSMYPEAMQTYNKGLALIDSLEAPSTYMALTTNKASIFEALGNISKAVALYQRGISFAEKIGDSSFVATALNNLGKLYFEEENFKEARHYLEEAIVISKKQELYHTLLRASHNLASTERDVGNYGRARELYRESWSLHQKLRPNTPPIQLLFNIGMLHLKVSEFEQAEEHFRESLEYSQEMGIPPGLFHNSVGLGDVASAREEFTAAISFYKDALAISQKVGLPPLQIIASENLYKAYKENGAFEKALKYHESVKQLSDSLMKVQQDEQLALAETELGLRKQQEINQLLQEKQARQEIQITRQNWLIAVTIVIILVILVLLYLLYRSNTEKEKINDELELQRKKLADLNEVKDKMLAILSHDLRAPLATIKGILYLLKEGDLSPEELPKTADEMEVSVDQNLNMLDNLLAWAREQMTGLSLNIDQLDVEEVVREVMENKSTQAKKKGIILKNAVEDNLNVKADYNLLKLIIRNLVSNSIKFSKGGDQISIEAEHQNGKVIFRVRDTGIGIPKEIQQNIFELNSGSRMGTENEKGTGLGLRLCKEFVEKQDGNIKVKSTEGEGTTITFSIPKDQ